MATNAVLHAGQVRPYQLYLRRGADQVHDFIASELFSITAPPRSSHA